MSTLQPRQKVRIKPDAMGPFVGEIGYITESAGTRTLSNGYMTRTYSMWRVQLSGKPNLPAMPFGSDELEVVS